MVVYEDVLVLIDCINLAVFVLADKSDFQVGVVFKVQGEGSLEGFCTVAGISGVFHHPGMCSLCQFILDVICKQVMCLCGNVPVCLECIVYVKGQLSADLAWKFHPKVVLVVDVCRDVFLFVNLIDSLVGILCHKVDCHSAILFGRQYGIVCTGCLQFIL